MFLTIVGTIYWELLATGTIGQASSDLTGSGLEAAAKAAFSSFFIDSYNRFAKGTILMLLNISSISFKSRLIALSLDAIVSCILYYYIVVLLIRVEDD